MSAVAKAVDQLLEAQRTSGKPLAIILAGHNGSGKSTMWRKHLSARLQIPLINADRMMLSVLPEPNREGFLPKWPRDLRDNDRSWMELSRKGVEAFVAQAIAKAVPFAMETVFSDWSPRPDGTIRSKIERIEQLQAAGYFVLLCFVGLSNAGLSQARVLTRVAAGGHDVPAVKLTERFPRTQHAIRAAISIADAAILVDNSLDEASAFRVCHIQTGAEAIYDMRDGEADPAIREWLDIIAPEAGASAGAE